MMDIPFSKSHPATVGRSVSAVILAAGRSSRQQGFKPLLPIGDQTVLEHCLDLFQGQEAGPIQALVVLGHRAEQLLPLVKQHGARPVLNPDPDQGMFSSVQAGAAALDASIQAFFVLPVDIPLVRPLTVSALLQAMSERHDPQAFIPSFAGRSGHPPLLRSSLIPAIMAYGGSRGLRGVLESAWVETVDVPDRHILVDIDTPEQYRQALDLWQHRDTLPKGSRNAAGPGIPGEKGGR